MRIVYERRRKPAAAPWIRRVLTGWAGAAALEYWMLPRELRDLSGLEGIAQLQPGRMIAVAAAIFAILFLLRKKLSERAEQFILLGMIGLLTAGAVAASFTWPFLLMCLVIFGYGCIYALRGWNGRSSRAALRCREQKGFWESTAVAAVLFFLFVSVWTVCRVRSFSVTTFDFGIFAQMFHSMKTTGLPITTVERDGALSHFAVHVSPIYYLLLPFYCVVPKPETLQVLQAAVLASAVLPLWKLGKHHNLSPMMRFGLCLLLLVYPAYSGGTGYDIHENAFLTPLLLWLFYGIDRRNWVITAIAASLTLMVKEDAAVYVAVVALFLLLRTVLRPDKKWGLIAGSLLLIGAVGWFAAVTGYLAESGDGVMTYRYDNFMYDGSESLITVIKAVLLCPMKAVFECADLEKLKFVGLTMGALAGLPLLTRRYERLVLLIPYLLVNLMTDYKYQFDVFFQYTYGSTACLIYLVLVNLADWKAEWRRLTALGLALVISFCCFCVQIVPRAVRYPIYCSVNGAYYDSLRSVLDTVPEGASVAATTFYAPYLSARDELYDIRYAAKDHVFSCEYVVVGVKDKSCLKKYAVNGEMGYENFVELLMAEGYEKTDEVEGKLEIYHKEK